MCNMKKHRTMNLNKTNMRIFNKMKKTMLVLAASLFCANVAFAEVKTGSYAVVADDIASGAQITSVEGITMTFGTSETWTSGSGKVTVDGTAFNVYASTNENCNPTNGAIPTVGPYVVFTPQFNGTVTGVVSNAGNTKNGYIVKNEDNNLVSGTVLIDGANVAWESGTPYNSAAKYNGGVTFEVEAGSTYYFYMSGSKMRFNGFIYTYDDAPATGGDETTGYDLTAYNEAVAAAEAYKATLNPEDEMDAMLIMSVEDLLGSAASWLEEVQADPEATQADVDFIAEDLTNNIALLKVQAEIEALRAEGQEVLALYPEETRTDNAGLVLALRNLPMMTMGYTMEQLIELRDAVKTAIPAFQLENNQLILDTAAKKATDYAATLDASEETGTAAQMEAYNTLTYYASEEVLAQIDATSYDAVMEYSQTIDAMLAQYQPAIEKEKAVMAATTAVAEAQATLAAGGTDEAGLADAIAKVNTILGEINMWDTEYTVADLTAAVEAMEAAEEAFVKANAFAAGTYYMKNVAAGKFFVAANNWGTRASLGEHGLDIKVEDLGNGKYALNTQVKPAKNNKCYLTSGGFVDGSDNAADGALSLVKQGDGIYAITFDGTNYMGYDGTTVLNLGLTDPTAEAAHWQFITKEEMIAAMEGATVENPADATFFIVGHDFCREDNNRNNTWQGGAGFGGGNHTNWCAEKWNANFDIYQDLTGLPNGYYTLTAQGFYRAGGGGATATDQHAMLYAGNVSTPLANILAEAGDAAITGNVSTPEGYGNVPNNMESAGIAFAAGLYADHSLTVQVTDGTLRVGVKKETLIDSDWTIFDNFELYYVGTEDPEAQYLALAVDSLNTLIADAEAWKATLSAEDATQAQVIQMIEGMIPAAQGVAAAPESLAQVNEMITSVYQFIASTKAQLAQMDAQAAQAVLASYEGASDNVGFEAAINKVYAVANSFFSTGEEGVVYTIADLDAAVAEMKAAQEAFVNENKPVETSYTSWIANADFEAVMSGWSNEGQGAQNATSGAAVAKIDGTILSGKFVETWSASAYKTDIYQEIVGLPAGTYTYTMAAFCENCAAAYVYANAEQTQVSGADQKFYSVTVTIAEGETLRVGFKMTDAIYWAGVDNASLVSTTTLGQMQNLLAEVVDSVAKLKVSYEAPVAVEALDAAVAAVKNSTIEECNASIVALNAAMDAFVEANEFNLKLLALADATAENPMDATFLIKNPNFTTDGSYWEGAPAIGGEAANRCAEKYNTNFNVYQDVTNVPDGLYTVSVQAFYRAGGNDVVVANKDQQNVILYAGDVTVPVMSILDDAGKEGMPADVNIDGYGYVPNGMGTASQAFTAGLYANNSLQVVAEGGTLRIGIKKETTIGADWAIFDNFQLTYHGIANPELDAAVDSLNTLIAEATAWKAELNAADEFHAQVIGMLDQMIPAAQAVADARESLETVNSMIFDVYSALGTYKPMVEQYDAKVAASAAIEEAKALLATYTEYTDAAGFVAAIANAENALTDVNMGMVTLEELTAAVEAMKVAQEAFVKENTPVITEVSVSLTHTASSYCEGDANVYKSTVDTEKEYINNSAFNGTWQGAAYAEFSVLLPEGISIKSATLTWTGIGESRNTRNTDVYYVNAGNAIDYAAMQGGAEKVNLEATKITSVTFPKGTSAVFTTDVTSAVETVVAAGQNYIIFKFTGNPGGGHLAGKADAANAPVLTLETADASTMTTYTVKYVDGAGAELKTADVYSILIGETATLADENKAAIYNEDKSAKYIYASCDKESLVTVADSASNVITATFREAAKYNYTVETVDDSGSLMITMGSYSGFEGENVVAPYYAYVLNEADSTLYESAKNGKEYNKYVDLTQDNMRVQVVYTPTTIKNIVYYQEAENVEGLTKITTGNTAIRSSNSASAYAADADVVLTTLAPGKYKLAAVIYDATKALNSEFCFIAGTDTILKAVSTAANWTNCASEEFTLTANTAISLAKGGSSSKGVDFFYIQKTGDVELPAKVAYLNQKGDANDAIYDALVAAGYAVDSLAYADSTLTAEMIEANLAGYDVVVLGGNTGSGAALAKTYTQLLGKVNVLSTKAFWYAAPGDGGSKGTNPGSADAPSLSIAKAAGYEGHPIYAGIEGDEFAVFNDMGKSTGRYLQGNGSFGSNTPEQATIGTTLGADCIGEAWVDGFGWIIIPVDGLQPSGYLTADGAQLFVNAVEYLIAGEQYEGPNAIEGVLVEGAQWPADIYDLSGRMVKKAATSLEGLQKGLYIINGKKVLVK